MSLSECAALSIAWSKSNLRQYLSVRGYCLCKFMLVFGLLPDDPGTEGRPLYEDR